MQRNHFLRVESRPLAHKTHWDQFFYCKASVARGFSIPESATRQILSIILIGVIVPQDKPACKLFPFHLRPYYYHTSPGNQQLCTLIVE